MTVTKASSTSMAEIYLNNSVGLYFFFPFPKIELITSPVCE